MSFIIIGAGSFGGGFSTIPMIEHEIVHVRGWITSEELAELITIAQMTPGPIGVNAATYTGFRIAGVGGAVAATAGFTLPSIVFCSALVWLLIALGNAAWMDTLKKIIQPAVVGLIIAAVMMYGKTAITDTYSAVMASLTFVILAVSRDKIHPILLILCGGIAGVAIYG
jgi:chromate transporter